MKSPAPASVRRAAELALESRNDLAELGIRLLGSEEHPARVVFHFSSDQGEHSICIEREDWTALPGDYLAREAASRVAAERRRREIGWEQDGSDSD